MSWQNQGMAAQDVFEHFVARADRYDRSSRWCSDDELLDTIVRLAAPRATDHVLDVACGTGLVGQRFRGKVARVVGVDLTPNMLDQAAGRLDELVLSRGEALPFDDGSFDVVVSRQGIQFMDDRSAVREMVRVARPGGRIVLVQLCAYGPDDRAECFEILRLRNPARRNFYMADEVPNLLVQAGCAKVDTYEFLSVEDVDAWADNGAIDSANRTAIRSAYQSASEPFRRLHDIRWNDDGTVSDQMLFVIAVGTKVDV